MKIFVCRPLPAETLAPLERLGEVEIWSDRGAVHPEVLHSRAQVCDALLVTLTERLDAEVLRNVSSLRAISQLGAGYDNVDVAEATRRGVVVLNTPAVTAQATADIAWLLVLATTRRLLEAIRDLENGQWTTWDPWQWTGHDLQSGVLGIVGLGQIGTEVARRAQASGVRTIYTSRTRRPGLERELGVTYRSLPDLLAEADVVSIHVSLSPGARGLIGRDELAQMKPGSYLVNTARGEAVDEQALLDALASGHLSGAGLDVYAHEPLAPDHPFVRHPRVVTLPHVGSATGLTRQRMMTVAVDNLVRVLDGDPSSAHVVNPQVLQTREDG